MITWTNITTDLDHLEPWGENPKSISKASAKRLLDYWGRIGQFQTVAIGPQNGNGKYPVYDGHQRLHVLKAAHGGKFAIDARVADRALTEDERAEMVVQAHAGTTGQWDWDKIASWDGEMLQAWGMDADLLGQWQTDAGALGVMLESGEEKNAGEDTEPQIDRAEELRKEWGVELGQMWQLGEHRLVCGDCTEKAVVERVMGGEMGELLFTSPPYSDLREYGGDKDLSIDTLVKFISLFKPYCNLQAINLGLVIRDFEVVQYWNEYIKEAKANGLKLLSWNVWNKGQAGHVGHQNQMFAVYHEWIFIFGTKPKRLNRTVEKSPESIKRYKNLKTDDKGRKLRTVRKADGSTDLTTAGEFFDKKNLGTVINQKPELARNVTDKHPAVMRLELPEAYVEAMTDEGQIVTEPFSGSGTTLIACQNLNRRCRAIEIDPGYVAVTLQRFLDHTGIQPEKINNLTL